MRIDDLKTLMAAYPEEVSYYQIAPKDIDLFNKIIEAYDHLGLVTTLDPKAAKVAVWTTKDTKPLLLKLIRKLPFAVVPWEESAQTVSVSANNKNADSKGNSET